MILVFSSIVLFCIRCCCTRKLSSGAVLSPHVVVTQVVPNTNGIQTNGNQIICETRPQMVSHLQQNTTPLMSSCDINRFESSVGSMPYMSSAPSAPPMPDHEFGRPPNLPTYEQAINQKI